MMGSCPKDTMIQLEGPPISQSEHQNKLRYEQTIVIGAKYVSMKHDSYKYMNFKK